MTQENPKKRRRGLKSIDEIEIVMLPIKGGEVKEFYSLTDAATYLGYKSETGMYKFLARHPEIKKHAKGLDESRDRYILKSDLDRAREARPVDD